MSEKNCYNELPISKKEFDRDYNDELGYHTNKLIKYVNNNLKKGSTVFMAPKNLKMSVFDVTSKLFIKEGWNEMIFYISLDCETWISLK